MDNFLKNRLFDRSDKVNAETLDDYSKPIVEQYKAAKKAKKAMKVQIVSPDEKITLADLTQAYMESGMSSINNVGREKGAGKKKGAREHRNLAAFEELARLATEEESEEPDTEVAAEFPTAAADEAQTAAETADT